MLITDLGKSLLELFYPRLCVCCGRGISWKEGFLCSECRDKVEEMPGGICSVCGNPLFGNLIDGYECVNCRKNPPPYRQARSFLCYRGPMAEAIKAYKYGPAPWLSVGLGDYLLSGFRKFYRSSDYDFIIPIPLHPRKRKERGFDQVLMLATRLGIAVGLSVYRKGLRRIRYTITQASLEHKDRNLNVRGAFSVSRSKKIKDRRILLLDDVYTTGATSLECSRVLMESQAKLVDILSLARAI